VSRRRSEETQPREALLELTVERIRMVAVVGRLGVRSGAGVVVRVGGGVQTMREVFVCFCDRRRGRDRKRME